MNKPSVVKRIFGATLALAGGFLVLQRGAPFLPTPAMIVSDAGAQSPPPLDHFQCYQSKTASGTAKFIPLPFVVTADQFGEWRFEVRKPAELCAPANVEGSDAGAPGHAEHLESYQIKRVPGTGKFPKTLNQTVVDAFGNITVDLLKPERLLVPTAKNLSTPPTALGSPVTDHFTCYKARTSPGTPKFIPHLASVVSDQFGALSVNIVKLKKVCVATNKSNEEPGAETHNEHLVCYQAKLVSGFTPLRAYTANGFGNETLDVKKPIEVCVPAQVNPNPATPTPTQTVNVTPTVTPTSTAATATPTLTATPTPTFTVANPGTPTKTATPTATKTPTPTATATPISRVCTIDNTVSKIALAVKHPSFGNVRLVGTLGGSQTLQFGAQDANGVRPVTIPANSLQFDPVDISLAGQHVYICVKDAGIDGVGKVDCNGGDANVNLAVRADHNTANPPGSNGGLPQDPECDDTRVDPDGNPTSACLESVGGSCNPNNTHPGACNSPTEYVESGTFASGDFRVAESLTLQIVSNFGPDNIQCTADDTYSAPAILRTFLTTGIARATVYDANNVSNSILDHNAPGAAPLGCTSCITQVTGVPRGCSNITGSGGLRNLKLVGALPVLDIDPQVGDAGVTIEITCN
ncbi:MAG: hypothetical protein ABIR79_13110 [Candidatus Binatia bacterium]